MALVKCPECGKRKVSSSADVCPRCGFGIKNYYDNNSSERDTGTDNIPRNKRPIKSILFFLLVMVALIATTIVLIHDYCGGYIFTCDTLGIPENSEEKCSFTIVYENQPWMFKPRNLYCNGEKISEFVSDPDNSAAFTTSIILASNKNPYVLTTRKIPINSESVTIRTFDDISAEEISTYVRFSADAETIYDKYHSENGFINTDSINNYIDDIYSLAKTYENNGDIIWINKELTSVSIQFSSGINAFYAPSIEGALSSSTPYTTTELYTYDNKNMIEYVPGSDDIKGIVDRFSSNCSNVERGGVITAFRLKDFNEVFGPNKLIIWTGHGSTLYNHAVLLFQESRLFYTDPNREEIEEFVNSIKSLYEDQLINGSISLGNLWRMNGQRPLCSQTIGINCKFVEQSNIDLTGSVVILNACRSAANKRELLYAFKNKGAKFVMGYPASVYCMDVIKYLDEFLSNLSLCVSGKNFDLDVVFMTTKHNIGEYISPDDLDKHYPLAVYGDDVSNPFVFDQNAENEAFDETENKEEKPLGFSELEDKAKDYFDQKREDQGNGYFSGTYRHLYNHTTPFQQYLEVKELEFSGANHVKITTFDGQIITGSYKVLDDRELIVEFDDTSPVEKRTDASIFKLADEGKTLFLYDPYYSEGIYELLDE